MQWDSLAAAGGNRRQSRAENASSIRYALAILSLTTLSDRPRFTRLRTAPRIRKWDEAISEPGNPRAGAHKTTPEQPVFAAIE
jgi:hypothetical protein